MVKPADPHPPHGIPDIRDKALLINHYLRMFAPSMNLPAPSIFSQWLKNASSFKFTLYAAFVSFMLYSCIFALRKAFGVAAYEMAWQGVDFKVWMVISQILGYMSSKFIGIKVISEMQPPRRAAAILFLTAAAAFTWLGFAVFPPPFNLLFPFLNGLTLGLIWGLVFSYLEGRRFTEILGASLSVSFIFSSGAAKSLGGYLMLNFGVDQFWMPFAVSALVFPPLVICLWMLNQLPPPTPEDERLRTKRMPMNREQRRNFFCAFMPGLILLVLTYVLLTVMRDFRDNFAGEIWGALGYADKPGIYALSETIVSLIVLVLIGSLMLIKQNRTAMIINHLIVIGGLLGVALCTWLFQHDCISPDAWMIGLGLGLYFGYIQFNSIFFDRLIAAFQYVSNVGFLIYLADSFGYLGSISVLLFKEFTAPDIGWISFFVHLSYFVSVGGALLMMQALFYFSRKRISVKSL